MSDPDLECYQAVMQNILDRTKVLDDCLENRIELDQQPKLELAALQIRKILELISLSTLAANRDLFDEMRRKYTKLWRVSDILREVESINSDYFPIPIKAHRYGDPNRNDRLEIIKDEVLSKELLVEIHGRCGDILHASNPYDVKKSRQVERIKDEISSWGQLIVNTLNVHQISMLGNDKMYVVHMLEEIDQYPKIYEFISKQ